MKKEIKSKAKPYQAIKLGSGKKPETYKRVYKKLKVETR